MLLIVNLGVNREEHGYDSKSITEFKIESKYPDQLEDAEEFNYRFKIANDNEKPTVPTERIINEQFKEGINYDNV